MVGECRGIFVQKRSECPARARTAGTFAPPEIPPGDRKDSGEPNDAGQPPENAAKGRRGGAAFPDV